MTDLITVRLSKQEAFPPGANPTEQVRDALRAKGLDPRSLTGSPKRLEDGGFEYTGRKLERDA